MMLLLLMRLLQVPNRLLSVSSARYDPYNLKSSAEKERERERLKQEEGGEEIFFFVFLINFLFGFLCLCFLSLPLAIYSICS